MKQLKLLFILLRPSLLSGVVSVLFALGLLVAANWSQTQQNELFREYVYGDKGLVTILQDSPDGLSGFTEAALSGSFAYNVVILLIAAAIGFLVYGVLEGFDRTKASMSDVWQGLHDSNVRFRQSVKAEVGFKVRARVIGLTLWIVHLFLTMKVLLPLGVALAGDAASAGTLHIGNSLAGLVVIVAALHGHVLLWRFLTLRPRLFGGKTAIAELYETSQSH